MGTLRTAMLSNVTSRPSTGQPPGVQSGGLAYPDQLR
jgi:hypothetical protein